MRGVIYAVVEGPSDAIIVRQILSYAYPHRMIKIGSYDGDITTERAASPSNIEKRIMRFIECDASNNHTFKVGDIEKIIVVTDLDGCYIPDRAVIKNLAHKNITYRDDGIYTAKRGEVIQRNGNKREAINHLVSLTSLDCIPFEIYFMSRNLEHALEGRSNINNRDKIRHAKRFVHEHQDSESLRQFFSGILGDMPNDYLGSWDYIRAEESLRSLERHTNIGILLNHNANSKTN